MEPILSRFIFPKRLAIFDPSDGIESLIFAFNCCPKDFLKMMGADFAIKQHPNSLNPILVLHNNGRKRASMIGVVMSEND
jgi:hypothetical protein